MVAYNFQRQFSEKIIKGEKTSTIRAAGKRRHAKPGDELQLYTGMRTKACELLTIKRCSRVQVITILHEEKQVWLSPNNKAHAVRPLAPNEIWALAQNDGFDSVDDFFRFFRDGLCEGWLIGWEAWLGT